MKYLDERRIDAVSQAYVIIRANFKKIFNFLMPNLDADLLLVN